MHITFDCPKCVKIAVGEVAASSQAICCSHCGWKRELSKTDLVEGRPANCLICGCQDLWRQKDFDQRLGVLIVGIAILLSTIAVAYMRPGLAMLILVVFGIADWILYAILPDRLVCYRCHSQYRHVNHTSQTASFDLEINERYRQEGIRMKQAQNVK